MVRLSGREIQLLKLLTTEALSIKEIALLMDIETGTIRGMIKALAEGLEVYGRSGLMIWAWQHPAVFKGEWAPGQIHKPRCACRHCLGFKLPKDRIVPLPRAA